MVLRYISSSLVGCITYYSINNHPPYATDLCDETFVRNAAAKIKFFMKNTDIIQGKDQFSFNEI